MVLKCIVRGCGVCSGHGISMHAFTIVNKKMWKRILRILREINAADRVCGLHFSPECFDDGLSRLKIGSNPSLNLGLGGYAGTLAGTMSAVIICPAVFTAENGHVISVPKVMLTPFFVLSAKNNPKFSISNSFRLSIYNMALNKGWMHKKNGEVSFGMGLLWGATGGAIGCYFSSPFFMVIPRL